MRLCLARSSDLHFERISRAPCHLNRSHRTPFLAADADRRFSPVAVHSKPCLNLSTGIALDDIVQGCFVASGWALKTETLIPWVCNCSRWVTSLSVVVTPFSPPHGLPAIIGRVPRAVRNVPSGCHTVTHVLDSGLVLSACQAEPQFLRFTDQEHVPVPLSSDSSVVPPTSPRLGLSATK